MNESDIAVFQCTVITANPKVTNITAHDPSNHVMSLVNGTVQLNNVTRGQAGRYSCAADNGVSGSPVTRFADLYVQCECLFSFRLPPADYRLRIDFNSDS